MSAPDEMVEAVRKVLDDAIGQWMMGLPGVNLNAWFDRQARAVLSVPALAEVIARDAKVREIVQGLDRGVIHEHPCAGPCLGCGAGPDESCNPPCRCDEGEDCRVAVLLEADRAPLRALAALYSEDGTR